MTREEALSKVKGYLTDLLPLEEHDKVEEIIKALEQEECEDIISRQAVLDIAKSSKSNWIDNSILFKRVNGLPPVTPKIKIGHWRIMPYEQTMFCSECNCRLDDEQTYLPLNYCPKCGAKMVADKG